ncbi:MAG: 3-oxoadipyl-CoA thiolase, partial [Solirubrobacteraceae bacterium]
MDPAWTRTGCVSERGAGVSREAQDQYAVRSHRLTARAWDEGFYENWVVPVPGTELRHDENLRRDTSVQKLAALRPAFVKAGG